MTDDGPAYTTACRRQYLAETMPRLSDAAIRLWLALAFHGRRNKAGRTECYPGMPALEKITGINRRSISRAIRELTTLGWLRSKRTRTSNLYHLTDQAPDLARAFRAYLFEL